MRPEPTVTAPDLLGMVVDAAWMHGHDIGVVVSSAADPDGPPVHDRDRPGIWVVTAQWPTAGVEVDRWSTVVVDVEERGDGETGDRQPLVPRPDPHLLRAARDPETGSADG